jgi:hypothetical protein
MHTDRMRAFPMAVEPLRMLPVVLTSLFVVVAAVDLLLVAQPALILSLREGWQHALSVSGVPITWGSLLAAGVAVAGIAIAAAVLSTFLRAVQGAPYAMLAPVLVGGCMLVAARLPVTLPLPVSAPLFLGVATLLLTGGGNLFRRGSFLSSCAGALLVAAPLALLAAGYLSLTGAAAATHQPFDRNMQIFTFVLAFCTLGAPLLAIACRRPGHANAWADDGDGMGGQIIELLERAQASEERAVAAERALARGGRSTLRLASDDDALAMMRPRGSAWFRWASWICCAAFLVGAYFAGYEPLQKRLNTQLRINKVQVEEQAHALTALRARFDRERSALEEQLAAANGNAPLAAAVPEQKPANASPAAGNKPAAPGTVSKLAAPTPAPKLAAPTPAPKVSAPAPAPKPAAPETKANGVPAAAEPAPEASTESDPTHANPTKTIRAGRVISKRRAAAMPNATSNAGGADPTAAPPPAPKSTRAEPQGVSRSNDPLAGIDGM